MPKWIDLTGFENEYIKVLGLSSPQIQEERNKIRKNKAEYWDVLCKRCNAVFAVAKPDIKLVHSCGCISDKKIRTMTEAIGQTYNSLTITGIDWDRTLSSDNTYKHAYVFATCKCGSREKSYDLHSIKTGHVKSCGCSKFNNPLIIEDLTGRTFNRLTVIGRDVERDQKERDENGTRTGNAHWLCKCSCGNPNLVSVTGYALKTGGTKSCGCLVSEMVIERNKRDSTKYNRPEKYKDNTMVINDDGSVRVYDENMQDSFLVDAEDYEYISKWYWRKDHTGDNPNKWYWLSNQKCEEIKKGSKVVLRLHQLIAERKYGEYDSDKVPDHLSRDPNDNRRCNIVLKTNMENSHNRRLSKANKSGKTGVYFKEETNEWIAAIMVNYKNIHLGRFKKYEDAVNARIEAEKKYNFTCDDVFPEYDLSEVPL